MGITALQRRAACCHTPAMRRRQLGCGKREYGVDTCTRLQRRFASNRLINELIDLKFQDSRIPRFHVSIFKISKFQSFNISTFSNLTFPTSQITQIQKHWNTPFPFLMSEILRFTKTICVEHEMKCSASFESSI